MKKIFDTLYRMNERICMLLLTFMVVIVSYIVFGRYVMKSTPRWGEELALMTMVWIGLLSSTLALRDDRHLRMTILDLFLPAKYLRILDVFNEILVLGFAVIMIWQGIKITQIGMLNRLSGLGISSAYFYISAPIAGCLMTLYATENLIRKNHDSR